MLKTFQFLDQIGAYDVTHKWLLIRTNDMFELIWKPEWKLTVQSWKLNWQSNWLFQWKSTDMICNLINYIHTGVVKKPRLWWWKYYIKCDKNILCLSFFLIFKCTFHSFDVLMHLFLKLVLNRILIILWTSYWFAEIVICCDLKRGW